MSSKILTLRWWGNGVKYYRTQAAISAGYSPKTAYSIGAELLKKTEIEHAISRRLRETAMGADEVVDRDYCFEFYICHCCLFSHCDCRRGLMTEVKQEKIANFRPQRRNLNKHKQRGMGTLETSMRQRGYVAPMTAAADGEIIDGSARLETSAIVFDDDVLVIHHDGTKPIIMVRDDIVSADSPEAREISIAANRVAQLNLDWDAEQLLVDAQAGLDLAGLFDQSELDAMLASLTPGIDDPSREWQGMPEFEQEDVFGAIATIKVHFATDADIVSFAKAIGQTVAKETKSIWHPKQENLDLVNYRCADES